MEENLKKTLAEHGVDKVFIYTRKTPVLQNVYTVCLFLNTKKKQIEARGVAICSVADLYKKSEGKNKAFGRAMQALLKKKNDLKIKLKNRNNFTVRKQLTIKNDVEKRNFRENILPELRSISDKLKIKIENRGKEKLIRFEIPSNYPIKIANQNFKYKSHFRPKPSGAVEANLINNL